MSADSSDQCSTFLQNLVASTRVPFEQEFEEWMADILVSGWSYGVETRAFDFSSLDVDEKVFIGDIAKYDAQTLPGLSSTWDVISSHVDKEIVKAADRLLEKLSEGTFEVRQLLIKQIRAQFEVGVKNVLVSMSHDIKSLIRRRIQRCYNDSLETVRAARFLIDVISIVRLDARFRGCSYFNTDGRFRPLSEDVPMHLVVLPKPAKIKKLLEKFQSVQNSKSSVLHAQYLCISMCVFAVVLLLMLNHIGLCDFSALSAFASFWVYLFAMLACAFPVFKCCQHFLSPSTPLPW